MIHTLDEAERYVSPMAAQLEGESAHHVLSGTLNRALCGRSGTLNPDTVSKASDVPKTDACRRSGCKEAFRLARVDSACIRYLELHSDVESLEALRLSKARSALSQALARSLICDTDYEKRYGYVLAALSLSHEAGFKSGIRIDPDEPAWPVVFIELPTGQVSWHMPQHPQTWDGHTTEDKLDRVRRFLNEAA